jgi:hypothetical protein
MILYTDIALPLIGFALLLWLAHKWPLTGTGTPGARRHPAHA